MIMLILLLISGGIFYSDNSELFEQVNREIKEGAEWHYIGKKALDPTSKSIPLQCIETDEDGNSKICGEPYILWKLKK